MSKINLENEKKNKIFKKSDIVVYSIIMVVIIVLFLTFFLINRQNDLDLIQATVDGNLVFEYSFNSQDLIVYNNDVVIYRKEDNNYVVTIKVDEDYNTILIDNDNNTVTMLETNCSLTKDCKYMSIKNIGDTIVCMPHKLIIKTDKNKKGNLVSGEING